MRNYNALEGVVAVVGIDGAELTCHNAEGEIVWSMGLDGGQHDAAQYRKLMQPEHVLALHGGNFVPLYAGRMTSQKHPNATDSGADPDWRPAKLSEYEQQMRQLIHKVGQQSKALDKRISAMASIERARPATEPDPEPVIEPEAEPTPEPEPAPDAPAKE